MTDLSSATVASTERSALGARALSRSASLAVDVAHRERRRAGPGAHSARSTVRVVRRGVHRGGDRQVACVVARERPVPLPIRRAARALGSGRRNVGVGTSCAVGSRSHDRGGAHGRPRPEALRPVGRARERSAACGEPLRRQVVAAGAQLHLAARVESGRDARSHPSARTGDAVVVGALRSSCTRPSSSGTRLPASCSPPRISCSSPSDASASSLTGLWPRSSSSRSPCPGPRPSRCARRARAPAWRGFSRRQPRWSCRRLPTYRARRGSGSPWRRSVSFSCGGRGRLDLAVWLGVVGARSVCARPAS